MTKYSLINEYVFDYRLVLDEDPQFEKFVDRVEPSCYDYPTHNPFEDHEELELESGEVRIPGDTVEENEIIDFIHNKDSGSRAEEIRRVANGLEEEAGREQVENVNLKKEYEDPPNPNYNPSILQLLPPTRFLKGGSKIWLGDNTFYLFGDARDDKPIAEIHRYRFSHRGEKIRLQDTQYWFDRSKDIMVEKKKFFKMWVYNTKTRQLYQVKKVKTDSLKLKSKFKNKVKNAFNGLLNSYWNGGNMPPRLASKFLNAITQAVVRDTGEIVTFPMPNPHRAASNSLWVLDYSSTHAQTIKLIVTILQHRVGQPIRWLNYQLLQNLFRFIMDTHAQGQFISGNGQSTDIKAETKAKKKMRRKTIFRMIPELRKSNHMKTAIKTLFGEDYNKFFIKLFSVVDTTTFITPWVFCMRKKLIPKEGYHWLVQTINSGDIVMLEEVVKIINPVIIHLTYGYNRTTGKGEDNSIVISYIKICKRFNEQNISMPSWHTWLDMYRMANQLHIRIRPNKLNSAAEVMDIHNKMSTILNRDRAIIQKYKDMIFEEFLSPDKEYDGFKFVQLRTAEELRHEGTVMHHCVGGYAYQCTEGRSIIFSMRKDDKSYITIELTPQRGYEILQQYTLHDITITNNTVIDLIQQWHADCLNLHKDEEKSYYDICQDKIKAFVAKERDTVEDVFQRSRMEHRPQEGGELSATAF